jgi:TM2 domain-containing membrane protein YozV
MEGFQMVGICILKLWWIIIPLIAGLIITYQVEKEEK